MFGNKGMIPIPDTGSREPFVDKGTGGHFPIHENRDLWFNHKQKWTYFVFTVTWL